MNIVAPPTPMTPQRVLQALQVSRFRLLDFVQPANLRIPLHAHAEPTLVFVLSGAVTDRFARREHRLEAGRALLRPAMEPHFHDYGSVMTRCLSISLTGPLAENVSYLHPLFASVHEIPSRALERMLVQEMRSQDALRSVSVECRLLDFLFGAAGEERRRARPPEWITQVRDRIEDDPLTAPSLETLASDAGVHLGTLTRAFRTYFRMSIGSYARTRRVRWAAAMLRTSERSIADVALEAGFYDQSHFTRSFQQVMGMTPARWRRAHAKTLVAS